MLPPRELPPCDLLPPLLDLLELLLALLELLRVLKLELREELELLRDVADLALRWLPTLLLEDDELPLKELPTELEAFG